MPPWSPLTTDPLLLPPRGIPASSPLVGKTLRRLYFRAPETQAMSGRHTRASTSRLRSYYNNLPRITRSKSRHTKNSTSMAAADPNPGILPGTAAQVPNGTNAQPGHQPGEGGGDDDAVPTHGEDGQVGPAPQVDMTDYGRRLQLLEEKLRQQEDARASRASSRASSRGSDAGKGRRPARPRSPTRSSRRSGSRRLSPVSRPRSARRSRTPPPRRGYSPTSTRSRSHRRSSPRPTRRRSRSYQRRRTSSRSRSHRRRSSSRATRSRSRRHSRSASRSRHRRPARTSPRASTQERSPRSLRADPAPRHEAARALEAQYPAMGAPTGDYLHKSRATLEPYRNLPPDIKTRAGERRSRKDLSLPEHLCGLLLMATKVIDPTSELHGLVEHAAQVAQDAVTIQWPTVRAWSQACLAHIQDDGAGWRDAALFKDERMRLSWCKGKSQPDIPIPCPAFNTATCPERQQHSSEGRNWLHLCAVCYYGLNDTINSHTAHGCRKKPGLKLITDEGRGDNRRRFNNNNRREDKPDRQKSKN